MAGFKTSLCRGLALLLERRRNLCSDEAVRAVAFSHRSGFEPDLPAVKVECENAQEGDVIGAGLYEAEIVVTLESSLSDDDNGASHEARLEWLEAALCNGAQLLRDWPEAAVTPVEFRITGYPSQEVEGRRSDSVVIQAAAHPWAG